MSGPSKGKNGKVVCETIGPAMAPGEKERPDPPDCSVPKAKDPCGKLKNKRKGGWACNPNQDKDPCKNYNK